MGKKNEKRVCWSCDADVSCHLTKCPYCTADVSKPEVRGSQEFFFKQDASFASPFQRAPQDSKQASSPFPQDFFPEQPLPKAATQEKMDEEKEEAPINNKKEMTIFLLFLPGIVFLLFGLVLLLFAEEGVLTLSWNQSVAIFYFLASLPMIFFGWKSLR